MTLDQIARFVASGGFADEDSEVVRDLLTRSKSMATQILDEPGTSKELKATASEFLSRLGEDTYAEY